MAIKKLFGIYVYTTSYIFVDRRFNINLQFTNRDRVGRSFGTMPKKELRGYERKKERAKR